MKLFLCHIFQQNFVKFTDLQKSYKTLEWEYPSVSLNKFNLSGVKLFPCDICEQKFSSNVALKEHIARHTDTRPYKCDVCDRWFRQVSCLRRHMITHSDETPFSCNVCSRKFSQMVYLKSHMRIHTGKLQWLRKQIEIIQLVLYVLLNFI